MRTHHRTAAVVAFVCAVFSAVAASAALASTLSGSSTPAASAGCATSTHLAIRETSAGQGLLNA